jgi:hypothetical protein
MSLTESMSLTDGTPRVLELAFSAPVETSSRGGSEEVGECRVCWWPGTLAAADNYGPEG